MKRVLVFVGGLLSLGCLVLLAAYIYTQDFFWDLESSKISPNGGYSIYKYHYTSDSDRHAPYGTYLYLQNTHSTQNPIKGYLIFAGYCGENMTYSWVNDQEIVVFCDHGESKNIRTLASKAYGIQIIFKSSSS
jgi:hypothetical protein